MGSPALKSILYCKINSYFRYGQRMQRAGVRRHRPDALPGDGNETTPPVPAILPKKSLRTALNVGGSLQDRKSVV